MIDILFHETKNHKDYLKDLKNKVVFEIDYIKHQPEFKNKFNDIDVVNNSHKTAIARSKMSKPARILFFKKLLLGNVLDYGCGHGKDAELIGADKYDPHYYPAIDINKRYKTIICIYVLNVVQKKDEEKIICQIHSMLKDKGKAYFAVRRDKFRPGYNNRKTFQRYSYPELTLFYKDNNLDIYILNKGER